MKLDSLSKKVLITGINGFTGVYLERYLIQKNFDVYGTVINKPEKVNHIQCDITKKDQADDIINLVRPDYVIHIAAISFVGESNTSLMYDVNVIGTENILKSLLEQNIKPKKIILASSATVYGNQNKEILDESMCPKPVNHYGCSKLSMEYMASNYFNIFDIIITRPFNYTGVGQEGHFLIPKIVDHFREKKRDIELGNTDIAREFNDVNCVVESYYELLMSDAKSTVVNLSSNIPIKLFDILDMMQYIAGYQINIKINPKFVRDSEIKVLAGSTAKLESIIGRLRHRKLEYTLKEMFEA